MSTEESSGRFTAGAATVLAPALSITAMSYAYAVSGAVRIAFWLDLNSLVFSDDVERDA